VKQPQGKTTLYCRHPQYQDAPDTHRRQNHTIPPTALVRRRTKSGGACVALIAIFCTQEPQNLSAASRRQPTGPRLQASRTARHSTSQRQRPPPRGGRPHTASLKPAVSRSPPVSLRGAEAPDFVPVSLRSAFLSGRRPLPLLKPARLGGLQACRSYTKMPGGSAHAGNPNIKGNEKK